MVKLYQFLKAIELDFNNNSKSVIIWAPTSDIWALFRSFAYTHAPLLFIIYYTCYSIAGSVHTAQKTPIGLFFFIY